MYCFYEFIAAEVIKVPGSVVTDSRAINSNCWACGPPSFSKKHYTHEKSLRTFSDPDDAAQTFFGDISVNIRSRTFTITNVESA